MICETVVFDKSGKNVAVGALSSAIQSIDNGDINTHPKTF